jgi:hypothetical protein
MSARGVSANKLALALHVPSGRHNSNPYIGAKVIAEVEQAAVAAE